MMLTRRALGAVPFVCLSAALVACGTKGADRPGAGGGTGAGGQCAASTSGSGATSTTTTNAGSTSTSGSSTSTGTTAATSSSSSGAVGACQYPTEYENGNGSVTFYTFSMGSSAVNCSFDVLGVSPDIVAHVPFGNGQYFGAMNTADYDDAATCGACVQIDRADTGQSVQIMIVDQCPSASNPPCKAGHIDLSEAAFLQIGKASEGYLGKGNGGAFGTISWKYIPCPESGGVSYRLKEPTNQYWNQILVEGHSEPVAKLEAYVNGSWQAATRESYNYWQVGSGDLGMPPYQIRVTDVNGDVITASLALASGDQQTTQQFPTCQ